MKLLHVRTSILTFIHTCVLIFTLTYLLTYIFWHIFVQIFYLMRSLCWHWFRHLLWQISCDICWEVCQQNFLWWYAKLMEPSCHMPSSDSTFGHHHMQLGSAEWAAGRVPSIDRARIQGQRNDWILLMHPATEDIWGSTKWCGCIKSWQLYWQYIV